jgi:hypothetical protein
MKETGDGEDPMRKCNLHRRGRSCYATNLSPTTAK